MKTKSVYLILIILNILDLTLKIYPFFCIQGEQMLSRIVSTYMIFDSLENSQFQEALDPITVPDSSIAINNIPESFPINQLIK